MNFIVGRLVQYLKDFEAFWVFAMLIETILPIDYYTQMIGIQIDVKVLKILISVCLPEVEKKFQSLGYDAMFFALNWFVCLYTEKFKENVAVAIIDLIIVLGSEVT